MLTRTLGDNGPLVSALGLGCNNFGWRLDQKESKEVLDVALDSGITLFDTADTYGETASETALGAALKGRRDRAVIISKFGLAVPDMPEEPGGSRSYIRWAVDGSCRRLGTDYVDVYMYHRHDGVTPWEETMDVLSDLHQEGRIRYAGVSNLTDPEILEKIHAHSRASGLPFAATENRYSLLNTEIEDTILAMARRLGIGLVPFYPLESGLLTGRYGRGVEPASDSRFVQVADIWPRSRWLTDEAFDALEPLEEFARDNDVSLLSLALGSLIATPGVGAVCPGASNPEQVRANVKALEWAPSVEQFEAVQHLIGNR
jgi:aryl-alcohol dehydrogenase-like predicted oxidoreductase